MTSGGARYRSGPAPDPNALRRDRKDDPAWTTLPAEYDGPIPEIPIGMDAVEAEFWAELWKKPQASQWLAFGLEYEVAAYVRAYFASVDVKATSGMKTAVLSMGAQLGLSLPGMHSLRWKFSEDEVGTRRESRKGGGARDRLRALNA